MFFIQLWAFQRNWVNHDPYLFITSPVFHFFYSRWMCFISNWSETKKRNHAHSSEPGLYMHTFLWVREFVFHYHEIDPSLQKAG